MKIHGIEDGPKKVKKDGPKKVKLFGRFERVWARVIG
jgi:hypothetical protein